MIDPHAITDFERSDATLEEFALFVPAVAGKTASQIALALDRLLASAPAPTPFGVIRTLDQRGALTDAIRDARLGKWRSLTACYRALASDAIDLRACGVEDLEAIPAYGPKSARFFLLHTRPDQRVAVLDTHILAHLRALGHDVPRVTPTSGPGYRRVERLFLEHAESVGRTDLAAYDLEIWSRSTTRSRRPDAAKI